MQQMDIWRREIASGCLPSQRDKVSRVESEFDWWRAILLTDSKSWSTELEGLKERGANKIVEQHFLILVVGIC